MGSEGGPTLLVLGDSLSFHGPHRAEPADEPRLWPHVAAAALDGHAELHAGLGWTARHAWRALTGDPRVWASIRRTDALVLGVGGMDTLPAPVPLALREMIPTLRPAAVRRAARGAHRLVTPTAARVLGAWGPVALPAAETVRHLERVREAVDAVHPGVAVAVLLPGVHRSPDYGGVHAGRAGHLAAITTWAGEHDVVAVDTAAAVGDHVLGGHGNPDGIHWGWEAHRAVGEAVAAALGPRLG